jgi:hypothetical protein
MAPGFGSGPFPCLPPLFSSVSLSVPSVTLWFKTLRHNVASREISVTMRAPDRPRTTPASRAPMSAEPAPNEPAPCSPLARRLRRDARALGVILLVYLGAAYLLLPAWWGRHRPPVDWSELPRITRTGHGLPGDPVNLALVGTEEDVVRDMVNSGWHPADRTTLRTALRIGTSTLFNRPYLTAPVSNLYLWGRRQDLAFERAAARSPRKRHHVRFWQSERSDPKEDRPVWVGAATFDRSVGVSRYTGQVTHHIDADVDGERDLVLRDLYKSGRLERGYKVPGFGKPTRGRNGGGDRYFTDGMVAVAVLAPGQAAGTP